MIVFNKFTENMDGIYFSSQFDDEKLIRMNIIDPYTGLIMWSNTMLIVKNIDYFVSHPRATNLFGFEIIDEITKELYLKIILSDDKYFSIENADAYKKIKNFKYSNKHSDFWAAFPLFDIFINKCYDNVNCRVEKDDVVVDIGANLGFFSYYSLIKGAKKVYSFEPSYEQYKAIKDNFGDIDRLIIENLAVTSDGNPLNLYQHKYLSVLSITSEDKTNDDNYIIKECNSVNLEEYCNTNNININFLKVDCEGAEYDIFNSLSDEFLKSIDKIAMECHFNTDDKLPNLISRFKSIGFTIEGNVNGEVGNMFVFK